MNKSQVILSLITFLCFQSFLNAQNNRVSKRIYTTKSIDGNQSIAIDGVIDEEAWSHVSWGVDFIERSPDENTPPTYQTRFKLLYDSKYLYFAVEAFDDEPDKIEKRLSRRDGFQGDRVNLIIDSYHDLRTAFTFTVTAAGVRGDEFATDNAGGNNFDASWNPVWSTKTKINKDGWTAEMRIPLSQLRFSSSENQVWGLNVVRNFFRDNERSVWNRVPAGSSGFVSQAGELHGIKNIKPQRQLEIQPFTVLKLDTYPKEEGNPFKSGEDFETNGGIDGKIGITNNLTLDLTVNPDFGQVEADPSVIALDGFQVFQREQRPFFVENKNIFDYQVTRAEAGGPYTRDNVFYSRRIGRSPQGSTTQGSGEFSDTPSNTTILGAAKFSGKTQSGLSIGILEAVTQEEVAIIDNIGDRREEVVEPLTNFFLTRLQKEYNNSNTLIGGILTGTNRNLTNTNITSMHEAAYSGGVDFRHQWKDRTWYVDGNVVVSKVLGDQEAIYNTQTSLRHNFQRVDAAHVVVDPTITSLTGTGGNFKLGKSGGGNFLFESGVTWRSPELELNDVGFQRNADDITHYNWMAYRSLQPFSIFRRLQVNYNHYLSWNFEGDHTYLGINTNAHATFHNNWRTGGGINYDEGYSDSELRGGPLLRLPSSVNYNMYVNSDRSKKLQFRVRASQTKGQDDAIARSSLSMRISYVPINSFNLSVDASVNSNQIALQYVTTDSYTSNSRYINANLDQDTFNLSLRLNYTITPNLSIQYYGSPFISRGRYTNFKYITNSLAANFTDRFQLYADNQISYDEDSDTYLVDENMDTATDYSFGNPDFSFIQFQSNLVARWEYIPGSEVFLVWSKGLTRSGDPMDNLLPSLGDNIFGQPAQNIFLIKVTYRFML